MTLDYDAFEAAGNLNEKLEVLGRGLTAFFRAFPDAGKVPLEEAGEHSQYVSHQRGLSNAIDSVAGGALRLFSNNEENISPLARTFVSIDGKETSLMAAYGQLEPHVRRDQQGVALHVFNNLASSGQPDRHYGQLVHLIGNLDRDTGVATFELPGFSPEWLSQEVPRRMAQAYYSLATESAARLYPDPIQAKHNADKHIAGVRKWSGGRGVLALKAEAVERSMEALYRPACAIAARDTALAAMSATLGESGVSGDYYADRVGKLLNEAGTTLAEAFSGGATINRVQLSAGDCVTRFAIAINNLNQASRVRAASGLKNS